MGSPLENLYPETETDPEPVFVQPGPVHAFDSSTCPLSTSARDYIPLKQVEEGELPDPDDQPDPDPDQLGTCFYGLEPYTRNCNIPQLPEQTTLGLDITPSLSGKSL